MKREKFACLHRDSNPGPLGYRPNTQFVHSEDGAYLREYLHSSHTLHNSVSLYLVYRTNKSNSIANTFTFKNIE